MLWLASGVAVAEPGDAAEARQPSSVIPFVRNHPCHTRYRQLAFSPPLKGTSHGDEGFPWRAMYGYCVAGGERWLLHQDWVVSYHDAEPQGDNPGGDGVSAGTDISIQWPWFQEAAVSPYLELGGGVQYAFGTPLPAHGSRFNFTINSGAGLLISHGPGSAFNVALRYLHISNGGLVSDNAGYDAFHLVIGVRW
jgi:hypothetical protein